MNSGSAAGTTAAFFVARLSSTRLPRKVLLPVKGKPLIIQQMERVKIATRPERFVLCTTDSPNDDELVAVVKDYGIDVFRGPELDVPRRLLLATEEFDVDTFALVEADEHFVDPDHVDTVLNWVDTNGGGDWVHVVGNPIGAWTRAISRNALREICGELTTEGLDGWGAFFEKQPERFKLGQLQIQSDEDAAFSEDLRLTIDYPEDFELLEALYDRLYEEGKPLRLPAIMKTLRENPELIKINYYRQDQYWERLKSQAGGLYD